MLQRYAPISKSPSSEKKCWALGRSFGTKISLSWFLCRKFSLSCQGVPLLSKTLLVTDPGSSYGHAWDMETSSPLPQTLHQGVWDIPGPSIFPGHLVPTRFALRGHRAPREDMELRVTSAGVYLQLSIELIQQKQRGKPCFLSSLLNCIHYKEASE